RRAGGSGRRAARRAARAARRARAGPEDLRGQHRRRVLAGGGLARPHPPGGPGRRHPPPPGARVLLSPPPAHARGAPPPRRGPPLSTRADYSPLRRAARATLDGWGGAPPGPPRSAVPRLGDGTAAPASAVAPAFARLPGARFPDRVAATIRLDFGPDAARGI